MKLNIWMRTFLLNNKTTYHNPRHRNAQTVDSNFATKDHLKTKTENRNETT